MSKNKISCENSKTQDAQEKNDGKNLKNSKALLCPDDYSTASSIYKAYSNGLFPVAHKILFNAICKALNGKNEGNIDFNSVLDDAHMHRSSALQIIKHMVNWRILDVSFHTAQAIGEKRKFWAYVKIIQNPEAQECFPKSA